MARAHEKEEKGVAAAGGEWRGRAVLMDFIGTGLGL
jgi:hypothetical protein